MLLRVGFQYCPFRLIGFGQGDRVGAVLAAEESRHDSLVALIGWRRALFAPHRAIRRLDGEFADMARCIGFPTRKRAFAALPRIKADMGRVLDRLVDGLRGQAKQRADTRRDRRTEMPYVVDVETLQRNALGQSDLYLVGGGHSAQDVGA